MSEVHRYRETRPNEIACTASVPDFGRLIVERVVDAQAFEFCCVSDPGVE